LPKKIQGFKTPPDVASSDRSLSQAVQGER